MGWFRRYIVRAITKEIETNGIVIGNKKISNKDGAISIKEVTDGK